MVVDAHQVTETQLNKLVKTADLGDAPAPGPTGLASRLLTGIAAAIPAIPGLAHKQSIGNGANGSQAGEPARAD